MRLPDHVVFYWVDDATPAQVAARARALGVRALAVKAGDSGQLWPQYRALADPLAQAGVVHPAWAYVRPETLTGDVAIAVAARDAGAECFIADMETPYLDQPEAARRFGEALRARLGADYPLLVTTFSGPDAFPTFPWQEVAAWADALVPQWYAAAYPGGSVQREADAAYPGLARLGRPVFPAGPLYGSATAQDVAALAAFARMHHIPTLFWWRWGSCPDNLLRQAVRTATGDEAPAAGAVHGTPPADGAVSPRRAPTAVRRATHTPSRHDLGAGERPRSQPRRGKAHPDERHSAGSHRSGSAVASRRVRDAPTQPAQPVRRGRTTPDAAPSPPPSSPMPTRGGAP